MAPSRAELGASIDARRDRLATVWRDCSPGWGSDKAACCTGRCFADLLSAAGYRYVGPCKRAESIVVLFVLSLELLDIVVTNLTTGIGAMHIVQAICGSPTSIVLRLYPALRC